MTIARTDAASISTPRIVRVFFNFFCFVLAGYVLLGKNFAYLGVPPLYVGEIALALGIAAALTAGNLTSAIVNLPGLALGLLMLWTACRTIPYWNTYGLDAPRDAMLVFYGLFAYIVASLILQWPATLALLIERYKRFIPFIIFLSPIIPMVGYISGDVMVGSWYLQVAKVGDLSCHLTAVIAFSLIGFVRLRLKTLLFILLIELFTFSQGREAMLAFFVGCLVASVFSPNRHALRRVLAVVGLSAVALSVLGALDFHIPGQKEGRDVAVRQLVINATSVFTNTGSERADVTREWRLNWWSDIIDYTVHGLYFWKGKGFGPSLADLDGYQVGDSESGPPLRSPHNAHMTILARGGVPALLLWIGALGSWLLAVMCQLIEAKKLRDDWWVGVFVFLLAYWTMMVVASSFDVALEGPVLGVWFWTIHGIGIAALILHRHRVATLQSIHSRASAEVR